MNITHVLQLIGGLAFFLYGMNVMSSGLERMAGGKLERYLKMFTSNMLKSILLGTGITIAMQSSSAVTVMLVGLVNSGIMDINQTVGVIMGANIGKTLTAWLTSLIGLESDNVWLALLKPDMFAMVFVIVGAVLIMMAKNTKYKDIGSILVGFAVLMYGMNLMSNSVAPLRDMPEFTSMLTAFNNPLLGVLVGAVFTGIIQSSAASVAILQALALTGSVSYGMAIPIIMGQNIGTCVTALISSIGVKRSAKKVAVIHISFNMLGTVILLALYYGIGLFVDFTFTDAAINAQGIAIVHTIFNITTTLILLPFSKGLIKIANTVLPDKKSPADQPRSMLDERLLATPSVAIAECDILTADMAKMARDTLFLSIENMSAYSRANADKILENETSLDDYEDNLGTYLVRLSSKNLSETDSHRISKMLHTIGDFERLGDHAVNILNISKELDEKKITFSDEAKQELKVLTTALKEILDLTTRAYAENDAGLAASVEPLEQVIDNLVAEIKNKHIQRLQSGNCTIEMGFILSDLLNNYERVSDHCSNIAVSVIEIPQDTFDTHKYLNEMKYKDSHFAEVYGEYSEKYRL